MSYIGRQLNNLSDRVKLDSITTSATATYNLLLNTVAYVPSSAESLTVSLNGVVQAPQDSYTVSSSTITFASALTSSDSIDFILAERSITLQTPSSGSVNTEQLANSSVTSAKLGNNSVGITQLNVSDGTNGQALTTNGSGTLSFSTVSADADNYFATSGLSNKDLGTGLHIKTGDSSADVHVGSDELVLEGSGDAGMTILTATNGDATIRFGDSGNNQIGRVAYNHSSNYLNFWANNAERMRILSDGAVKASTSSFEMQESSGVYHEFNQTTGNVTFRTRNSHSSPYGNAISFSGAAPNNTSQYALRFDDSGSLRFIVYSNGNVQNDNNSYGATSDIKLKEQVTDASSQWNDIKNLKVRKFKFKKDVANGDSDALWKLGLIAQEAETVSPNLIESSPDRDPVSLELTGESTKAIKYSVLYMKSVKALQEAMDRIETLEAENTDIKARLTALENA